MAKEQINSHDSFFTNLFSKKDEVAEFLAKTTPKEIVEKLDLDSLKLDSTKYIDSDLKKHFADVVYNCDYAFENNETKTIKITFLFEHKSYRENMPYIQLGKYLFNIWSVQRSQARE